MYQAQQDACAAQLYEDLMAQSSCQEAQCGNIDMMTGDPIVAYTAAAMLIKEPLDPPYTSYICNSSLFVPVSRLHLLSLHHEERESLDLNAVA